VPLIILKKRGIKLVFELIKYENNADMGYMQYQKR
jgi:hypothetical protein